MMIPRLLEMHPFRDKETQRHPRAQFFFVEPLCDKQICSQDTFPLLKL